MKLTRTKKGGLPTPNIKPLTDAAAEQLEKRKKELSQTRSQTFAHAAVIAARDSIDLVLDPNQILILRAHIRVCPDEWADALKQAAEELGVELPFEGPPIKVRVPQPKVLLPLDFGDD